MRILLFGSSGQLGWQLQRSLALLGEVVALDSDSPSHAADFRHPHALAQTVAQLRPDVVVNAAAYTAVDRAECEPELAFTINATACEVLAGASAAIGAWLVHYSSDYVFDGTGERPWRETDPAVPLGSYGRSKLAGDLAVARGNPRHLVLRSSWLFDSWGGNFLKTILRAARTREALAVVADQWGAPTRAALLADATALALQRIRAADEPQALAGTYHVAARGATTWHGYACLAIEAARSCGMPLRATPATVRAISTADHGAPAPRPANSRLDSTLACRTFGLQLPAWEDGVRQVVAELAQAAAWDQP